VLCAAELVGFVVAEGLQVGAQGVSQQPELLVVQFDGVHVSHGKPVVGEKRRL
jgi:hypothetical protein